MADAFIVRTGTDLPKKPQARESLADPACLTSPLRSVDLPREGVRRSSGLPVSGRISTGSRSTLLTPRARRSIRRASHPSRTCIFWVCQDSPGVGRPSVGGLRDAKHIADQIAIQRTYHLYDGTAAIVKTAMAIYPPRAISGIALLLRCIRTAAQAARRGQSIRQV